MPLTSTAVHHDGIFWLYPRMAHLGLDPDAIALRDASVLRDMQETCALCVSKRRCRRDLARFAGPSEWRGYCRNDGTLQALMVSGADGAGPEAANAAGVAGKADVYRSIAWSLLVLFLVALGTIALFVLQPPG